MCESDPNDDAAQESAAPIQVRDLSYETSRGRFDRQQVTVTKANGGCFVPPF